MPVQVGGSDAGLRASSSIVTPWKAVALEERRNGVPDLPSTGGVVSAG
jgi:hypothetical protein